MAAVEKAGLFADLDQATISQVPPQYRPSTGKWTGVAARTTVFAYNKSKLHRGAAAEVDHGSAAAASGRAAGAPRPSRPTSRPSSAAMLQLTGEPATAQWLAGMKANAQLFQDNIATLRAVNDRRGRRRSHLPLLLVPRSGQDQGDQRQHRAALLPQRGSGRVRQSISGGGILNSSKKKDQAQKFLTFVTSKAGQEVLEKGTSFEYPVGQRRARQPRAGPARPPAGARRQPVGPRRRRRSPT